MVRWRERDINRRIAAATYLLHIVHNRLSTPLQSPSVLGIDCNDAWNKQPFADRSTAKAQVRKRSLPCLFPFSVSSQVLSVRAGAYP